MSAATVCPRCQNDHSVRPISTCREWLGSGAAQPVESDPERTGRSVEALAGEGYANDYAMWSAIRPGGGEWTLAKVAFMQGWRDAREHLAAEIERDAAIAEGINLRNRAAILRRAAQIARGEVTP